MVRLGDLQRALAVISLCSSDKLANTTGGSDALLGDLGEELGAHDARGVRELTLAENLEEALKQIVY